MNISPNDAVLYAIAAFIGVVPVLLVLLLVVAGLVCAWSFKPLRIFMLAAPPTCFALFQIYTWAVSPDPPPPSCEDSCYEAYDSAYALSERIKCLDFCVTLHDRQNTGAK